jgi:hypothetical protein
MKESRYVRMARTMLRVLKHARIPLFLHRKSNHVFTVWQHVVLLTMRQYEGKSYRMFAEWLVEAHYLKTFLHLSRVPHFTTLQKFAARISGTLLERIIATFILLTEVRQIFLGPDSSGFKPTHASQYYTIRAELRTGWIKLSIGGEMIKQVICTIKIRRGPGRHDNIDFKPLVEKAAGILPLSVVTADKGYDDEDNHVLVRERYHAYSVIPPRYQDVPVWRTHGRYRKLMKRGYPKVLYNQRNKDETIFSVMKRLFGEYLTSVLVRTQNRELAFRCMAYNMHRVTNLLLLWVMVSTQPIIVRVYVLYTIFQYPQIIRVI